MHLQGADSSLNGKESMGVYLTIFINLLSGVPKELFFGGCC
jgi:hypothetical protein